MAAARLVAIAPDRPEDISSVRCSSAGWAHSTRPTTMPRKPLPSPPPPENYVLYAMIERQLGPHRQPRPALASKAFELEPTNAIARLAQLSDMRNGTTAVAGVETKD